MCESYILEKTGLTVRRHQELTIQNYLDLMGIDGSLPVIPVLQGWSIDDYLHHVDMWYDAGVDVRSADTVGVGGVCRRQATSEIIGIVESLVAVGMKNIHGFGVKASGLRSIGRLLRSADSMAWSFEARRRDPLPGHTHKKCANCYEYALLWRDRVLNGYDRAREQLRLW